MDFDTINTFYGWGVLTPSIIWYRWYNFIDDAEYKEITGEDYVAPKEAPSDN